MDPRVELDSLISPKQQVKNLLSEIEPVSEKLSDRIQMEKGSEIFTCEEQ